MISNNQILVCHEFLKNPDDIYSMLQTTKGLLRKRLGAKIVSLYMLKYELDYTEQAE